jgi:Uncharacterised nucleotidyltransferase
MSYNPSVQQILRGIDDFYMARGEVYETLRRLAQNLREEEIDYAILGGMALALHGFVRPTQDIDLLLTPSGLEKFHERLVGRGYIPLFQGARKHFRDSQTGVPVEIITSGEFPGDGKPKPVSFPVPAQATKEIDGLNVVQIARLIELKLASGLSAEHRRLRELADIQQLIETLNLPEELGDDLDNSVRDEYARIWKLAQQSVANDREESM